MTTYSVSDWAKDLGLEVRRSPLQILVIDSDTESTRVLGTMLSLLGYAAEVAKNGEDGLCAIQTSKPSTILIAADLKGAINCAEVVSTLQANPINSGVFVILLTEGGRNTAIASELKNRIDGMLEKPVLALTLLTLLRAAESALKKNKRLQCRSGCPSSKFIY